MQRPACHTFGSYGPEWLRVVAVLLPLLLLSVSLMGLSGCTKSPVEKLIDQSTAHMQAAHQMMMDNAGDITKLGIAVIRYRSAHRGEFRQLRKDGETALNALEPSERKAVMARAKAQTAGWSHRIENAAKRYKNERLALRVVHPLIVGPTPLGLSKGQRPPWQPKFKKMPTDGPAGGAQAKPGADQHGHAQHGHSHNGSSGMALPRVATTTAAP